MTTTTVKKKEKAPVLRSETLGHNYDIDELIKGMRKAGAQLRKTPEDARKYLLSTGFYTKGMKLKKRFR